MWRSPLSQRRPIMALAGLFAMAMVSVAADDKAITLWNVDPTNVKAGEPGSVPNPHVRPNNKESYFVRVTNNSQGAIWSRYTVELRTTATGAVLATASLPDLKKGESATVKFVPPAPPKEEPKAAAPAPAPKKDGAEPPKADPPPPGVALQRPRSADGRPQPFGLAVRVLDGGKKAVAEQIYTVIFAHPRDYVETSVEAANRSTLTATVKPLAAAARKDGDPVESTIKVAHPISAASPAEIAWVFPPQNALKAADLGAGSYRRTLDGTPNGVRLQAGDLPLRRAVGGDPVDPLVRFHFNVDQYPRAFRYKFNVNTDIKADAVNKLLLDADSVVRMVPADDTPKNRRIAEQTYSNPGSIRRIVTLPTAALKVRVEADASEPDERAGAVVKIRVDRSGTGRFDDADENIVLGRPKNEQVWINLAEPDKGIVLINSVTDYTTAIDVSALRGTRKLEAVLQMPGQAEPITRSKFDLVVDDTPAEILSAEFPEKRIAKGGEIPVRIRVRDTETSVERVVVALGKPGPDGKLAPEVVLIDATPVKNTSNAVWEAGVPVAAPAAAPPPDPKDPKAKPKKDPIAPREVTIITWNEVGLPSQRTVVIQLVEPPGATVEVAVKRGGRSIPNLLCVLRDAEGKEKGLATTDAKTGVASFKNVLPGIYRVTAAKEDSSTGLLGAVPVEVPDPPPAPEKPIKAEMTLIKRR